MRYPCNFVRPILKIKGTIQREVYTEGGNNHHRLLFVVYHLPPNRFCPPHHMLQLLLPPLLMLLLLLLYLIFALRPTATFDQHKKLNPKIGKRKYDNKYTVCSIWYRYTNSPLPPILSQQLPVFVVVEILLLCAKGSNINDKPQIQQQQKQQIQQPQQHPPPETIPQYERTFRAPIRTLSTPSNAMHTYLEMLTQRRLPPLNQLMQAQTK